MIKEFNDFYQQYHEKCPMFVIYRPSNTDKPGQWVVRAFTTLPFPKPSEHCGIANNLEQARDFLPPGLHNAGRDDLDPEVIEESWV